MLSKYETQYGYGDFTQNTKISSIKSIVIIPLKYEINAVSFLLISDGWKFNALSAAYLLPNKGSIYFNIYLL